MSAEHPAAGPLCSGRERGSILVFSIWALVLISLFAAAVSYQVRQRLRFIQYFEIRDQLRQIADSGVLKMMHEISASRNMPDSLLSRWAANKEEYGNVRLGNGAFSIRHKDLPTGKPVYGAVDEERKVNLAEIKSQAVLSRLIRMSAEVSSQDASDLSASLFDWMDEDDVLNAGGAEARYYRFRKVPYEPRNGVPENLEELLLVKGMTPDIFEALRPYVTLNSSGRVNINTAPANVLIAHGFNEQLASHVAEYRDGRDKIPGTEDDRYFPVLEGMVAAMDPVFTLSDAEKESLESFIQSGLLTVQSEYFLIPCQARLFGRREALSYECLVTGGKVLRCRETFYRLAPEQVLMPPEKMPGQKGMVV